MSKLDVFASALADVVIDENHESAGAPHEREDLAVGRSGFDELSVRTAAGEADTATFDGVLPATNTNNGKVAGTVDEDVAEAEARKTLETPALLTASAHDAWTVTSGEFQANTSAITTRQQLIDAALNRTASRPGEDRDHTPSSPYAPLDRDRFISESLLDAMKSPLGVEGSLSSMDSRIASFVIEAVNTSEKTFVESTTGWHGWVSKKTLEKNPSKYKTIDKNTLKPSSTPHTKTVEHHPVKTLYEADSPKPISVHTDDIPDPIMGTVASKELPSFSSLKYADHGKQTLVDANGQTYHTAEAHIPYLAYTQAASADIASLCLPAGLYVPMRAYAGTHGVRILYPSVPSHQMLTTDSIEHFTPEQCGQMLMHSAVAWMLGNGESSASNYSVDSAGNVLALTVAQLALSEFKGEGKANVQADLNQPARYMIDRFVDGSLAFEPSDLASMIGHIEKIPNNKWQKVLENAVQNMPVSAEMKAKILGDALARKNAVRQMFEGVFSKALTEKNGSPSAFKFDLPTPVTVDPPATNDATAPGALPPADAKLPSKSMPSAAQLTDKGDASKLGGAKGGKRFLEDSQGNQYLFKKAVPSRAAVQQAVGDLSGLIVPEGEYVPVSFVSMTAKAPGEAHGLGTIQPILQNVIGDGKKVPHLFNVETMTPQQLKDIQREAVIDWAFSNHDGHKGNILVLENGRMIGIDKEQAFRYMVQTPDAEKLSIDYEPNAHYGELEPFKNTLYRAYAEGKVQLDLNDTLPYIQQLEKASDDQWSAAVQPYVDALATELSWTPKQKKQLTERILARKHNTREDFRKFFSELETKRTGKPVKFVFSDEGAKAEPAKPVVQAPVVPSEVPGQNVQKVTQDTGLKMPKVELPKPAPTGQCPKGHNTYKTPVPYNCPTCGRVMQPGKGHPQESQVDGMQKFDHELLPKQTQVDNSKPIIEGFASGYGASNPEAVAQMLFFAFSATANNVPIAKMYALLKEHGKGINGDTNRGLFIESLINKGIIEEDDKHENFSLVLKEGEGEQAPVAVSKAVFDQQTNKAFEAVADELYPQGFPIGMGGAYLKKTLDGGFSTLAKMPGLGGRFNRGMFETTIGQCLIGAPKGSGGKFFDSMLAHGVVRYVGEDPNSGNPMFVLATSDVPEETMPDANVNTENGSTTPGFEGVHVAFDKKPKPGVVINDIPLASAKEGYWNDVSDVKLNEPPMTAKPGKKPSSGVLVVEPDGRVWLVEPANHYGGYEHTFPKGGTEEGLSVQQNALKELYEEAGLSAEITGFLGDAEGDTSITRYYVAKRTGGAPWEAHWESANVKLVSMGEAAKMLNKERDKGTLANLEQYLAKSTEKTPSAKPVDVDGVLSKFLKVSPDLTSNLLQSVKTFFSKPQTKLIDATFAQKMFIQGLHSQAASICIADLIKVGFFARDDEGHITLTDAGKVTVGLAPAPTEKTDIAPAEIAPAEDVNTAKTPTATCPDGHKTYQSPPPHYCNQCGKIMAGVGLAKALGMDEKLTHVIQKAKSYGVEIDEDIFAKAVQALQDLGTFDAAKLAETLGLEAYQVKPLLPLLNDVDIIEIIPDTKPAQMRIGDTALLPSKPNVAPAPSPAVENPSPVAPSMPTKTETVDPQKDVFEGLVEGLGVDLSGDDEMTKLWTQAIKDDAGKLLKLLDNTQTGVVLLKDLYDTLASSEYSETSLNDIIKAVTTNGLFTLNNGKLTPGPKGLKFLTPPPELGWGPPKGWGPPRAHLPLTADSCAQSLIAAKCDPKHAETVLEIINKLPEKGDVLVNFLHALSAKHVGDPAAVLRALYANGLITAQKNLNDKGITLIFAAKPAETAAPTETTTTPAPAVQALAPVDAPAAVNADPVFTHKPIAVDDLIALAAENKIKALSPVFKGLELLNASSKPMAVKDIVSQLTEKHEHTKNMLITALDKLAAKGKINKIVGSDGQAVYFVGEVTGIAGADDKGPKQPSAEALPLFDHLRNIGVKPNLAPDIADTLTALGAEGKDFTAKEFVQHIVANGDPTVGWYGAYALNWIKTMLPKKGLVSLNAVGKYEVNAFPSTPTGQCPKGHNTYLKPAPDHCPTCGTPMAAGSENEVSAPAPEVKAPSLEEMPAEQAKAVQDQQNEQVEQQLTQDLEPEKTPDELGQAPVEDPNDAPPDSAAGPVELDESDLAAIAEEAKAAQLTKSVQEALDAANTGADAKDFIESLNDITEGESQLTLTDLLHKAGATDPEAAFKALVDADILHHKVLYGVDVFSVEPSAMDTDVNATNTHPESEADLVSAMGLPQHIVDSLWGSEEPFIKQLDALVAFTPAPKDFYISKLVMLGLDYDKATELLNKLISGGAFHVVAPSFDGAKTTFVPLATWAANLIYGQQATEKRIFKQLKKCVDKLHETKPKADASASSVLELGLHAVAMLNAARSSVTAGALDKALSNTLLTLGVAFTSQAARDQVKQVLKDTGIIVEVDGDVELHLFDGMPLRYKQEVQDQAGEPIVSIVPKQSVHPIIPMEDHVDALNTVAARLHIGDTEKDKLNEVLAVIYGVPEVSKDEMRKLVVEKLGLSTQSFGWAAAVNVVDYLAQEGLLVANTDGDYTPNLAEPTGCCKNQHNTYKTPVPLNCPTCGVSMTEKPYSMSDTIKGMSLYEAVYELPINDSDIPKMTNILVKLKDKYGNGGDIEAIKSDFYDAGFKPVDFEMLQDVHMISSDGKLTYSLDKPVPATEKKPTPKPPSASLDDSLAMFGADAEVIKSVLIKLKQDNGDVVPRETIKTELENAGFGTVDLDICTQLLIDTGLTTNTSDGKAHLNFDLKSSDIPKQYAPDKDSLYTVLDTIGVHDNDSKGMVHTALTALKKVGMNGVSTAAMLTLLDNASDGVGGMTVLQGLAKANMVNKVVTANGQTQWLLNYGGDVNVAPPAGTLSAELKSTVDPYSKANAGVDVLSAVATVISHTPGTVQDFVNTLTKSLDDLIPYADVLAINIKNNLVEAGVIKVGAGDSMTVSAMSDKPSATCKNGHDTYLLPIPPKCTTCGVSLQGVIEKAKAATTAEKVYFPSTLISKWKSKGVSDVGIESFSDAYNDFLQDGKEYDVDGPNGIEDLFTQYGIDDWGQMQFFAQLQNAGLAKSVDGGGYLITKPKAAPTPDAAPATPGAPQDAPMDAKELFSVLPSNAVPKPVVTTQGLAGYKTNTPDLVTNYAVNTQNVLNSLPTFSQWEQAYPGLGAEFSVTQAIRNDKYDTAAQPTEIVGELVNMGLTPEDAEKFKGLLIASNLWVDLPKVGGGSEKTLILPSFASITYTGTCPNGHKTKIAPKPKYCPSCGKPYAAGEMTPTLVIMPHELTQKAQSLIGDKDMKAVAATLAEHLDPNGPFPMDKITLAMSANGQQTWSETVEGMVAKLLHAGFLLKNDNYSFAFAPIDTPPKAGAVYSMADYAKGLLKPSVKPCTVYEFADAVDALSVGGPKTVAYKALMFVMKSAGTVQLADVYKAIGDGSAPNKATMTKVEKMLAQAKKQGFIQVESNDKYMFHGGWEALPNPAEITVNEALKSSPVSTMLASLGPDIAEKYPHAAVTVEDMLRSMAKTDYSTLKQHEIMDRLLNEADVVNTYDRVRIFKALIESGKIHQTAYDPTKYVSDAADVTDYSVAKPSAAIVAAVDSIYISQMNLSDDAKEAVIAAVAARLNQAKASPMSQSQFLSGLDKELKKHTVAWASSIATKQIYESLISSHQIESSKHSTAGIDVIRVRQPVSADEVKPPKVDTETAAEVTVDEAGVTGICPAQHKTYKVPAPLYCPTCGKPMQATTNVPKGAAHYNALLALNGMQKFVAMPDPTVEDILNKVEPPDGMTWAKFQSDVKDIVDILTTGPLTADHLDKTEKELLNNCVAAGLFVVTQFGNYASGYATMVDGTPPFVEYSSAAEKAGQITPYSIDLNPDLDYSKIIEGSTMPDSIKQNKAGLAKVLKAVMTLHTDDGVSMTQLINYGDMPSGSAMMLEHLMEAGLVQAISAPGKSVKYFVGGWIKAEQKAPPAPVPSQSSAVVSIDALLNSTDLSQILIEDTMKIITANGGSIPVKDLFVELMYGEGITHAGVGKVLNALKSVMTEEDDGTVSVDMPVVVPCSAPKGAVVAFNLEDFSNCKIIAVAEKPDMTKLTKAISCWDKLYPNVGVALDMLAKTGSTFSTADMMQKTGYPYECNLVLLDAVESGVLQKFSYTDENGSTETKFFFGHWEKATDAPLAPPAEAKMPTGLCKNGHKTYVTPKPDYCPTCGTPLVTLDIGIASMFDNIGTYYVIQKEMADFIIGADEITTASLAAATTVKPEIAAKALLKLKAAGILSVVGEASVGAYIYKMAPSASMPLTAAPADASIATTSATPLGNLAKPPKTVYVESLANAGVIKPVITEFNGDALKEAHTPQHGEIDTALINTLLVLADQQSKNGGKPMTAETLSKVMTDLTFPHSKSMVTAALLIAADYGLITQNGSDPNTASYIHGYWAPASACPAKPVSAAVEPPPPPVLTSKSFSSMVSAHFDATTTQFLGDFLLKNDGAVVSSSDVADAIMSAGFSAGQAGAMCKKLHDMGFLDGLNTAAEWTFHYPDAAHDNDIKGIQDAIDNVMYTNGAKTSQAYKTWLVLRKIKESGGLLSAADVTATIQSELGCTSTAAYDVMNALNAANLLHYPKQGDTMVTVLMPSAAKDITDVTSAPDAVMSPILAKVFDNSSGYWDHFPVDIAEKVLNALQAQDPPHFTTSMFASALGMTKSSANELINELLKNNLVIMHDVEVDDQNSITVFIPSKVTKTPTGVCSNQHKTYLVPLPKNCTTCGTPMQHIAPSAKVDLAPPTEGYTTENFASMGATPDVAEVLAKKFNTAFASAENGLTIDEIQSVFKGAYFESLGITLNTSGMKAAIDQLKDKGLLHEVLPGQYEISFNKVEKLLTPADVGAKQVDVMYSVLDSLKNLGYTPGTSPTDNDSLKIKVAPGSHLIVDSEGNVDFTNVSLGVQSLIQKQIEKNLQVMLQEKKTDAVKPPLVVPPKQPPPAPTPSMQHAPTPGSKVPSEFLNAPGYQTGPIDVTVPIVTGIDPTGAPAPEPAFVPKLVSITADQAILKNTNWTKDGKGHGVCKALEAAGPNGLTKEQLLENTKQHLAGSKLDTWKESSLDTILAAGAGYGKCITEVTGSSPTRYTLGSYTEKPPSVASMKLSAPDSFIPHDAPPGIDHRSYQVAAKLGFDLYNEAHHAAWVASPYYELVQGIAVNPRRGASLEASGVNRSTLKKLVESGLLTQDTISSWNEATFAKSVFKLANTTVNMDSARGLPPPALVEFDDKGKIASVKMSAALEESFEAVLAGVKNKDVAEKFVKYLASDPGRQWMPHQLLGLFEDLPAVPGSLTKVYESDAYLEIKDMQDSLVSRDILISDGQAVRINWPLVLSATTDSSKPICSKCDVRHRDAHLCPYAVPTVKKKSIPAKVPAPGAYVISVADVSVNPLATIMSVPNSAGDVPLTYAQAKSMLQTQGIAVKKGSKTAHLIDILQTPMLPKDINVAMTALGFKGNANIAIKEAVNAGVITKMPNGKFVLKGHGAKVALPAIGEVGPLVSDAAPQPNDGVTEIRKQFAADHPIQRMAPHHAQRFAELLTYMNDAAENENEVPATKIMHTTATALGKRMSKWVQHITSVGLNKWSSSTENTAGKRYVALMCDTAEQLGMSTNKPFKYGESLVKTHGGPVGGGDWDHVGGTAIKAIKAFGDNADGYVSDNYGGREYYVNPHDVDAPMYVRCINADDATKQEGTETLVVDGKHYCKLPSRAEMFLQQYAVTQASLSANNITSMSLLRGVPVEAFDSMASEASKRQGLGAHISVRQMTGWTTNNSTASSFGGGVIYNNEKTPAHMIFAHYQQKLLDDDVFCLSRYKNGGGEREILVIGQPALSQDPIETHRKVVRVATKLKLFAPPIVDLDIPNGFGRYVHNPDGVMYWVTNKAVTVLYSDLLLPTVEDKTDFDFSVATIGGDQQ